MKDKLQDILDNVMDFVEDYKKYVIIGAVVVVVLIVCSIIRGCNAKAHEKSSAEAEARLQAEASISEDTVSEPVVEEPVEIPESKYQSELKLRAETDGRVEPEEEKEVVEPVIEEPNIDRKASYEVAVKIYDKTAVPDSMVDGSSCKDYLGAVTLEDFGSRWGTALTEDDFTSTHKYLVGVEQWEQDFERGDLESVGWVLDNIASFNPNDAIKFTNLHVIGSLSSTHVAVLCSYDWYSVFGLKDVLVVFEDISDTLSTSDFTDGTIFSATVFVHNIKVVEGVQGQRVLCIQYATFE